MTVDTSTAPLLVARQVIAAEIESATGYDTYLGGQENMSTPAVVVEPNGWSLAHASASVVSYTCKVTCLYNAAEGSIDGAEEMARRVFLALASAGWLVPDVPPAGQVDYGSRPFIGCQFTAGTRITLT
jgi:hypothetical protein